MRKSLSKIIQDRVTGIQLKLRILEKEKFEQKLRSNELDREVAELNLQLLRAKRFDLDSKNGPFCPTCFIERGENITFRPVSADPKKPKIDQFECNKCGSWMEINL